MIDRTNRNSALASALVEELARCGMRQAVISPGSRSTPLAIAFYRRPEIEVSVVIDERSAGFIALGAAQASGLPVALVCTSGTAAANYHPAITEADLSAVPLLALTADRPPELRGIGAGQTIDQIKLYGAAVRWFCEVGNHEADDTGLLHMRSTACRAYAAAAGDLRPGPVHLNLAYRDPLAPIPEPDAVTATNPLALDGRGPAVLEGIAKGAGPGSKAPIPPLTAAPQAVAHPPQAALEEVTARIAAQPRGLILAGRQTDPGLREPLAELARLSGYPILAEPTSQLRAGPHELTNVIWGYDEIRRRSGEQSLSAEQGSGEDFEPGLILRFGEFPTSKRLRLWVASLNETQQVVFPGKKYHSRFNICGGLHLVA